jgi:putative tricarboxylic transport membrane protein
MASEQQPLVQNTISSRWMELIVAGGFMASGAVVMWDSHRVGASWASDGPQAGYFPFYVALIMFAAGTWTFVQHVRGRPEAYDNFVGRLELVRVLEVLIPSIIFVVLVGHIGIYVAGFLFIAYFMWRLGRFPWRTTVPVALAVPIAAFLMFEIWFLVPLPKGPLENWLGY